MRSDHPHIDLTLLTDTGVSEFQVCITHPIPDDPQEAFIAGVVAGAGTVLRARGELTEGQPSD